MLGIRSPGAAPIAASRKERMEVVLFLLSVVAGNSIAAGGVDGIVKSSHSSHRRRIPELG